METVCKDPRTSESVPGRENTMVPLIEKEEKRKSKGRFLPNSEEKVFLLPGSLTKSSRVTTIKSSLGDGTRTRTTSKRGREEKNRERESERGWRGGKGKRK